MTFIVFLQYDASTQVELLPCRLSEACMGLLQTSGNIDYCYCRAQALNTFDHFATATLVRALCKPVQQARIQDLGQANTRMVIRR